MIREQVADALTGGRLSALGTTLEQAQEMLRTTRGDITKLERTVEGMKDGSIPLSESAGTDWAFRLERDRGWVLANGATIEALRRIQKSDIDMYHDLATFAYIFNPLIKSAVNIKTRWTFAKMCNISSEVEANQKIIDAVTKDPLNKNAFFSKQAIREIDHELQKGGNIYPAIHMYSDPVGVRVISSYEITDIVSDPDDADKPMYYCRSWTTESGAMETRAYPSIFNDNPEAEIKAPSGTLFKVDPEIVVYHMHTAKSLKQKWALSELTAARPWAQAHAQFLEDYGAVVAAYRKYSHMMTTKGGASQVTALSNQFKGNQSAMNTPLQSNPAGSMVVASEGNELKVIDAGSGKMVGLSDSRTFLLQVCADTGVPDTLLVGDSNNGNLATATALEGPFGILIEDRQSDWQCTLEMVFTRILGNPEFDVSFPPLRSNVAAYITAVNNVATLNQAGNWAGTVKAKDYIKAVHEVMEWKLPEEADLDEMAAAIEEKAARQPETPGIDNGLNQIAMAANGLTQATKGKGPDEKQPIPPGLEPFVKKAQETLLFEGGAGSGNFDHAGIPGQVGGSAPGGGGSGSSGSSSRGSNAAGKTTETSHAGEAGGTRDHTITTKSMGDIKVTIHDEIKPPINSETEHETWNTGITLTAPGQTPQPARLSTMQGMDVIKASNVKVGDSYREVAFPAPPALVADINAHSSAVQAIHSKISADKASFEKSYRDSKIAQNLAGGLTKSGKEY